MNDRYEYKVMMLAGTDTASPGVIREQLEAKFNALGVEGWRLHSIDGALIVFERQLPKVKF